MNPLRVAVACDFREEDWPSMDLVGEMLLKHLQRDYADSVSVTRVCPAMQRRVSKALGTKGNEQRAEIRDQRSEIREKLFNADRFLNRFWDYPRVARRIRNDFDLFHLVDHSYSQLLHELPPERTIVTCHDLDTFQCLLNPEQERRSVFFKTMMKRTLSGLRKAAIVTCDSVGTREQLLAHGLVGPERMVVVPNGVHRVYSPEPEPASDARATRLLGNQNTDHIDILHVGSTIPRKRIDVLLRVLAALGSQFSGIRLIRVGGPFTNEQMELLAQLELAGSVIVLPYLERNVLAAVYRRAALVLQPSDREGFGLPVIEAIACGTPVVASDIPVLREVGGDAVSYCPVAEVPAWSESISNLLWERDQRPEKWAARQAAGIAQAARFSWAKYAQTMVGLYREILSSQVTSQNSEVTRRTSFMASVEKSVQSIFR